MDKSLIQHPINPALSFKLCTTSDTIQLTNCNYYLILKRGVVGYAKQVFKYVN